MTAETQLKKIVLATRGSPGDVFPFLAIGVALRARGHHVTVATSEVYRNRVTAAGLAFAAVRPDRAPGQQEPDFVDRVIRERRSPGAVFRAMFLPSLRESVEDLHHALRGADAVVSHTLAPGARLAAEAQRIPWISAVMQPMGYLSAYEPPIVGVPVVASILRAIGPGPAGLAFAAARRLTRSWVSEWDDLRRELGLPAGGDHPLWEGQHAPRRSLGLFPRVLGEPQPDWPVSARVTGFPFFRPADRSLEPGLRAFLATGEPPLVFTLGTTAINDPGAFFTESSAAAQRLGMRAVLLTGEKDRLPRVHHSGDIFATPSAPHDLLFPHALAIVHQGGIGTLSEVLLAGKPSLIMPYGHDQADNAWRARELGVARIIDRRRYRAGDVARSLERRLDDPAVFARATMVGRAVARDAGAETAANLIVAACEQTHSPARQSPSVRTPQDGALCYDGVGRPGDSGGPRRSAGRDAEERGGAF